MIIFHEDLAQESYIFCQMAFPSLGNAISWVLVRLHLMGLAWVFSQLAFWLKWKLCWNWNQTFTDESFQRYQCFCFVIILSKRTRLWDLVNRWFHHVSPAVAAEDGPGQCECTFLSRSGQEKRKASPNWKSILGVSCRLKRDALRADQRQQIFGPLAK